MFDSSAHIGVAIHVLLVVLPVVLGITLGFPIDMGNDDRSFALLSLTTTDGGDDGLLGTFASEQDEFFL